MASNKFTDKMDKTKENINKENEILKSGKTKKEATFTITKKEKKTNKSYYLSKEVIKKVDKAAKKNKVSSSQLVEQILDQIL